MEITSRIHSIPAPQAFYTGPQAPNVFLVTDGGEGALIDSGFGDEQSVRARLEYLRERPDVKLRYIVLTHHHVDHSSGKHVPEALEAMRNPEASGEPCCGFRVHVRDRN